jgi:hypothetical protein
VFDSLAVFQAIFKHSSEEISAYFLMNSATIGQSSPPITLIILDILIRLGIPGGEAKPIELAVAMLFVIQELSNVEIAIGVDFNSSSTFLVVVELTFVKFTVPLDVNSSSLPLLLVDLAEVDLVVALDQLEL